MKIKDALAANREQPILFISDPTEGDEFVFGTEDALSAHRVRSSSEGHEVSTAAELLSRLDFEVYEGNEPTITRI